MASSIYITVPRDATKQARRAQDAGKSHAGFISRVLTTPGMFIASLMAINYNKLMEAAVDVMH